MKVLAALKRSLASVSDNWPRPGDRGELMAKMQLVRMQRTLRVELIRDVISLLGNVFSGF